MKRRIGVCRLAGAAVTSLALCGCAAGPGRPPGHAPQLSAPARTRVGACPGADPCPYARVALIGRRGEGVLRKPEAIALSPAGDVYVGDQFSYVIQRFSSRGSFEAEWGSYGNGAGQLGAVDGLATDSGGEVYVIDSANDRVQKFDSQGRFIASWGSHGSAAGQFNFGRGAGPGSPPGGGIAVFGAHVYVADTNNNRIVRFALDGTHPAIWDNARRGLGQAFTPRGIAVTPHAVYVTDEGNRRIDLLDHDGRLHAQAGSFGTGPGKFADTFGVAVDGAGEVFVADDNNNRIVKLDRHLRYLASWRDGRGGRLSFVRAVAADPAGHVYVADAGNDHVEVFDHNGRPLYRWGVSGAAHGQLVAPLGVALDRSGGPLVVETFGSRSPIYRFSPTLAYRSSWSRGGGAILGRHFFSPTAAAVSPDGSVWVTDRENSLIRHLSAAGEFLDALGGGGGAGADQFARPAGVAVDRTGNVYVADTDNSRVQKLTAQGRLLSTWDLAGHGRRGISRPLALAVDRAGRVYVADAGNERVIKLDRHGTLMAAWGGAGTAPGRFRAPDGIAVDPRGHVFVSDRDNNRIQEFTATGRLLTTWGTPGTGAGEFSRPGGLSIDCRGDLLVADTRNNRVQVFRRVASRAPCVVPTA